MQILEELYNIFGPELKGVAGNAKSFEEVVCRIHDLVMPIEELSFNPFNICKVSSWKRVMQEFDNTVQVSFYF